VTTELRTVEPALLAHEGIRPPADARPGPARSSRRAWVLVLGAVVAWCAVRAGVGGDDVVNEGGWTLVRRFLGAAVRPEASGAFLRVTWDAAVTTLAYAVLATVLSVALGLALGVIASETWWSRRRAGWAATRGLLSLPRGVHEVVYGLLLVTVLGLDPLVAILAIGLPYGVVTAKVYSELLDETDHAAYDAVRAAGAGRAKALLYALLPQARGDMVSYAFYRFECSIRAAAILGVIGAGGLGFQLSLSFQSLRYGEMWTLIYALVLLCGLADWWSTRLRRREGDTRFVTGSAAACAVLVVGALWHLRVDLSTLWSDRAAGLFSGIVADAWPPDLRWSTVSRLAGLAVETIEMSVLAIAVASLAGAAVAFVASGGGGRGPARAGAACARAVLLVCRAIPPPVGALLFLFVLYPGPLPGALALALYNFGILARLMAEVVENLDHRPARTVLATGASRPQMLLYAVLPAALPRFAAYSVYRWEVTVRETVVVGLVGAGGLGRQLSAQLTAFDYAGVTSTLLALVLLTFVGDLAGAAVRRSLR
jgi:phosphonate transport system permease protein